MGRLFRLPWAGSEPADHDRGRELRRAVRAEDLPRIRKMIHDGVGVNESQEASLACIATRRRNLELLKLLVEAGVDVNQGDRRNRASRTRTPLQEAARKGWDEGVALLLAAGAHADAPDDHGYTALALAVREGKTSTAQRLLEVKARPQGHPSARMTPLHEAPTPELARLLLNAGASIDAPDVTGATALHHQARQGRLAMIEALLGWGANPGALDARGRTVLFMPTGKGDEMAVFQRLLSSGVDPLARDADLNTFAHWAVMRCVSPKLLAWLYEQEPRVWALPNRMGETPQDLLAAQGEASHRLLARVRTDEDKRRRQEALVTPGASRLIDAPSFAPEAPHVGGRRT